MLESSIWDSKITNGRRGVFDDLGLLALQALASPFGDVLLHGRPDDFGGDGLACAFHAWVAESVEDVKHSSAT